MWGASRSLIRVHTHIYIIVCHIYAEDLTIYVHAHTKKQVWQGGLVRVYAHLYSHKKKAGATRGSGACVYTFILFNVIYMQKISLYMYKSKKKNRGDKATGAVPFGTLAALLVNESCHIRTSHVTYRWVMSRIHKLWNVWMSHVTVTHQWFMSFMNEGPCSLAHCSCVGWWVMSHMNGSCHIWMSRNAFEWVMSHINESCHLWMSHVTYEWDMSHMNESCPIWISHVRYEWVMSHMNESYHVWMSHITVTYEWLMW